MKFADFGLKKDIINAIEESGFSEPTLIQEKCIPAAIEGRDIIGQSKTGSGKTAAFGIPILEKLSPQGKVHALILTPTRELCVQVTQSIQKLGKFTGLRVTSIFGGVDIEPQISELRKADIVVATPGRVMDHMQRGTIDLHSLKFLVLDEVDRMADMGFIDDVERIISALPKSRQNLFFSATMTYDVNKLAARHLKNPVMAKAETYVDEKHLRQVYYNVPSCDKFSLLIHLIRNSKEGLKLVFCATRGEVDVVAENLRTNGVNAMPIHGGLTQSSRMKALDSLKEEKIDVLVATDVAARGLDIKNVDYVFNYDVPKTAVDYLHRVGRTARAGESGTAITILCEPDYENFRRILRDKPLDIKKESTPRFQIVRFDRYAGRKRMHLPASSASGARRSFGENRGFGARRPAQPGGYGERRSFGDRKGSGERRGFGGSRGYGNRKPPEHGRDHSSSGQESDMVSHFSGSDDSGSRSSYPRRSFGGQGNRRPGHKKKFQR